MKKIIFVVFLLLSQHGVAESLQVDLNSIESEWASIYYGVPKAKQKAAYEKLLVKTENLAHRYPKDAGAMYWQAVIKASYADHQDAVSALDAIFEVRDLLKEAIKINPKTMNGSAYVVLGTLYYMAPAWPIAFGDDDEADKLLKTALEISPDGIDSNYFYGEFLVNNNKLKEAESYFEKASKAPIRREQVYGDTRLQEEAKAALQNTRLRKVSGAKSLFLSLFSSASAE